MLIQEYENAIVLPNNEMNGGVYYKNEFVFNTSLHQNWIQNFPSSVCASNKIDEEVVYIGCWHNVWGHCITDNLKHLWFLLDKNYESLKNLKFVYISVFENFSIPKNFSYMLEKLGIKENQLLRITEPTEFKKIYVPEECFYFVENEDCRKSTKEYKDLIDFITKDIKADTSFEKIYFSRTAIKSLKDIGEKQIENYVASLGYKIIHPQNYTFEQQVAILKGCKTFCTTEGSISHNVIFCTPATELVILRKDDFNTNSYQNLLNNVSGVKVTSLSANKTCLLSKKHPWTGPFFLCVTKEMESFFGKKRPDFNLALFLFLYLPLQILRRCVGK